MGPDMKKHLALLLFLLGVLAGSAHASAQEAISLANEGTTGTTVGKLAKSTGAPSTAIITGMSDTDHILGIVVAQDATATTGNAKIAVLGIANCTFDASGVTAGHFVINSSVTAGDCADGTATRPTTNQVLGVALATVASGTAAVNLQIGFTNAAGSGSPGNPTATIGTSAVNGSAGTFMRSDAAPAAPQCSASTFGLCKPDGTTITASAGVITASGGSATSITPGTTTVVSATAPCVIRNSTSTTMDCQALGGATSAGSTQTIAAGTSALGTGAISSATCATVVTTTATGTATTDVVTASFNGDPTAVTGYIPATAGMLTIISYPTANNVNFKVCNNTTSSITPGAITLNWRVVR